MRTYLPDFECVIPSSIEEALQQKAERPERIPIAGGTDVFVWMNFGILPGPAYQSLHRLAPQWRTVRAAADGGLQIGALATYSDVRFHPHVKKHYPLLVEAARVTGALQIQNRGTPAGNIANGSPAADTVPALMVYDARVRAVSVRGERTIDLAEFFTGYRTNALEPDELIAEILLPPPAFPPEQQYYRKVGTRQAQAISKVVFAGARTQTNEKQVRLAWGSVAPVTLRSLKTEEAVARGASPEEAWAMLQQEISPIDDVRSTREYRLKVSRNILFEFLEKTKV